MKPTNTIRDRLEGSQCKSTAPEGQRLYAIGDIHGRADLLRELHNKVQEDAQLVPRHIRKTIIYLGDYIDRGFNSREVIDLLIEAPLPGFDRIHLKGNHEDIFLRFLEDHSIGPNWFSFGGDATAASYGVLIPPGLNAPEKFKHVQQQLLSAVPATHLHFLRRLQLTYHAGDYIFVHAGIRPGIPIENQVPEDLLWIRREFLYSRKSFDQVVIHGHSLSHFPDVERHRIGIDTGAYATNHLTCLVLEGTSRRFLSTGRRPLAGFIE